MKKTKQVSNSLFWLKHIMLALMIIVIAAVVIIMQQSNESAVLPEGNSGKKSISSNMSNFYADYLLAILAKKDSGTSLWR